MQLNCVQASMSTRVNSSVFTKGQHVCALLLLVMGWHCYMPGGLYAGLCHAILVLFYFTRADGFTAVGFIGAVYAVVVGITEVVAWYACSIETRRLVIVAVAWGRRRRTRRRTVCTHATNDTDWRCGFMCNTTCWKPCKICNYCSVMHAIIVHKTTA